MAVRLNVERKAVEIEWDETSGADRVVVYGQGEKEGEWHNTSEMNNDGLAALSYPRDFTGSSLIEVRDLDGNVLDSGTVEVG